MLSITRLLKSAIKPYTIRKTNFSQLLRSRPKIIVLSEMKPPKRLFFSFFKQSKNPEYYKTIDNVPDDFDLIYRNTMSRYIYLAQVFSSVTTVAIFALIAFRSGDWVPWNMQLNNQNNSRDSEKLFFFVSFVLFGLVLQVFIARLPIRIYRKYKAPNYLLVFEGVWPFGTKMKTCKIGEVVTRPETGFLPWRDSRYMILKENEHVPVIMLYQFFRKPADLSIMIGEQKDPDLK